LFNHLASIVTSGCRNAADSALPAKRWFKPPKRHLSGIRIYKTYRRRSGQILVLTNSDKSKKVSLPLKQDALKSETRLLVQIDPANVTDFGTTQTTLNVTLAVGSKSIETDLHFDYTGTPTKASTPKPTPPKATPPKAKAPNTTDPHALKFSPASFDFSKESRPKPLTNTGDHLQLVDTLVLATSLR
jgi:hypothetical protein